MALDKNGMVILLVLAKPRSTLRARGEALIGHASCVDGTLEGPYAEYAADGVLLTKGRYLAGQKSGA